MNNFSFSSQKNIFTFMFFTFLFIDPGRVVGSAVVVGSVVMARGL